MVGNLAFLKERYGRNLSTKERLDEAIQKYNTLWDSYEKTVTQRDELREVYEDLYRITQDQTEVKELNMTIYRLREQIRADRAFVLNLQKDIHKLRTKEIHS